MSLARLLETRAHDQGASIFAIFPADDTSITYDELWTEARQASAHLAQQGLTCGGRITFVAKKSRDLVIAYLGSLLLGATVHIVDERIDPKDTQRSIALFDPNLIVVDSFGIKQQLPSTTAIKELGDGNLRSRFSPRAPADLPGDTPAICVFTSGSTGDPKGILSSHDNLLFAGRALESHDISKADRVLGLTPISGTNGQVFSLWAPLATGGSTIQYQGMFSSFLALDWAAEHSATWINGTPTYLSLFLANPVDPSDFNLSGLRFFRSASAPLPEKVQNRFEATYKLPIIETMGLSEMTGQVFSNPSDLTQRRKGSVGLPFRSEIRVVDDDRQPVRPGEVGELEVRSEGLMLGYFDDPAASSTSVVDGWLRTGDLVMVDDDGFVFVRGRRKDIAIIGGKNVSLRRVDDALYALPGVQLATSVAVPDDSAGGEQIVAILQLEPSAARRSPEELSSHLKAALANYELPGRFEFWDELPLGGSGKVLRSKARQLYLQHPSDEGERRCKST